MDKSLVKKICVDDFAFRKRYSYGTVMIDLDSHRIIDVLESRETKAVEKWLRSYPNLEVISRDGAQTYASASTNSHPHAIQVSDRFHLLKNLSDAVEIFMRKLFPSRLVIPMSTNIQSEEMKILYNTANRRERILFAQLKRNEGYTVNDIALLLHSGTTTIQRYLTMQEDEIPESKLIARERQHEAELERKQAAIDEVRRLKEIGCSIEEISRKTGHTRKTIKIYLDPNCPVNNAKYDRKVPGKLFPYEKEVISLRSQGVTYTEIHKLINDKGYTGSVASLRVFMQKERSHMKREIATADIELVDYIPRKILCQLIYKNLEEVKGITKDQYEIAVKKYPVLGQLYHLLKEFHRIIFSHKTDELDSWIESTYKLKIDELNTYLNGIKSDIKAVKNSITYQYNNGLAEGSVNKIKLTKRIMYGRNSFHLLKAKLLLNELYYAKIN